MFVEPEDKGRFGGCCGNVVKEVERFALRLSSVSCKTSVWRQLKSESELDGIFDLKLLNLMCCPFLFWRRGTWMDEAAAQR